MITTEDDPHLLTETGSFPVLPTPRLNLRALTLADAADLLAIYGDLEVTRYANADRMTTLDEARDMITFFSSRFTRPQLLRWAITRRNAPERVIGTCGYHGITRRKAEAWGMISYDLARACWGRGFMTEALRAVIAYGFDGLAFDRIEAETFPANRASARVLEKIGFEEEASTPSGIRNWSLAPSSYRRFRRI